MNVSKKICIIMANITEDYSDDYVIGMEKQANRLGYHTFIFSMPLLHDAQTNSEAEIYQLIDFEQYDGVIFFENSFSAYKRAGYMIEDMLHKNCKKPVIVLGESQLLTNIYQPDHSSAIEALTDHIIDEHGCELLYFLGGEPNQPTLNDKGFIRSLEKHNLPCTTDNLIYGGYWMECGEALAKDIAYHVVEKPDAVICQDDTVAFFFIKALARHGIRVPEDIIVTGFGARRDSRNNLLSITTYPSNAEYDGRKVMARLHALITHSEEPQISSPKNSLITGMSCGCGDRKPDNIRLQLELHEKQRLVDIYYQNSELEEKFIRCTEYKDLYPVILHSSYLIQDKSFFTINVKDDENTSRCIYMRHHVWEDTPNLFPSHDIYPPRLQKKEGKNMHVLPITYDGQFLGHVVVGYDDPIVYNTILKKYVSRLGMALSLMQNRVSMVTSASPVTPEDTVTGQLSEEVKTIFIQKGGTLHKVPLENILMFESEGRKTMAVLKSGRYEIKKTLSELEEQLVTKNFMRVSKSALVNLNKIISLAPAADRTILITLSGKINTRVSRKHAADFKKRLELM